MNIYKVLHLLLVMLCGIYWTPCWAQEHWEYKLTYESQIFIDSPFFLNTTADINKNGIKELIVTDFGRYGDHIEEWKDWREAISPLFNLIVLEWEKNELNRKWSRQWDMKEPKTREDSDKYFRAYEARQMMAWTIGGRVIVETIPPYLGLEWNNGKYILNEQQGTTQGKPLAGSWAFPWLSPFCYYYGNFAWSKKIPMRECLVGIRDFSGKGQPKIVTILDEEIIKDKEYKQKLRVRRFEPGFPIEWEQVVDLTNRFIWWDLPMGYPSDRLNQKAKTLLMREVMASKWYLFGQDGDGKNYHLRPIQAEGGVGVEFYDLPDIYLRSTQKKGIEEYWGYHRVDIPRPEWIDFKLLLGKVTLKPDLTGFVKEMIDFPQHKQFLSAGYFDLQDIDNDDLDEVIMVEETGKKTFDGHESVTYSDIKDYIRILKWNGKEYQTMWVSPPYTKRGTKFLVDDIKNTGKKQLVVLSPYGTVQIWEKQ